VNTELWIAIFAAAIGTFALRALPLIWMQRHLRQRDQQGVPDAGPPLFTVLGPTMIAALFGVSLLPVSTTPASTIAVLIGCLSTYLVWRWTQSLGIPVAVGVAAFGVVTAMQPLWT